MNFSYFMQGDIIVVKWRKIFMPDSTFIYLLLLLVPCLGSLVGHLYANDQKESGAKIQTLSMWLAFCITIGVWILKIPSSSKESYLSFYADELSWLMATLMLFVSASVHHFSIRYMLGDRYYGRYFLLLGCLTVSALLFVAQDHLLLAPCFLAASNFCLVQLMIHKSSWQAAYNAGLLALKNLAFGVVCFLGAAILIAYQSGCYSIHELKNQSFNQPIPFLAFFLLVLVALVQSANIPFHRWLISSLNSPTPVSALMHAGLVNGGGYLLVRFSFLVVSNEYVLNILFVLGLLSSLIGMLWKLVQSDVKRMLACSTMAQMGFMIMQCGLGLFAPAIAHLCFHGLFKGYLFLQSGSSVAQKRIAANLNHRTFNQVILSLICGAVGASFFAAIAGFSLHTTQFFVVGFCFMAISQLALVIVEQVSGRYQALIALCLSACVGCIYGGTILAIETLLTLPLLPIKMAPYQWISFAAIAAVWLLMNLRLFVLFKKSAFYKGLYVWALTSSQPHHSCVTCVRQTYQY